MEDKISGSTEHSCKRIVIYGGNGFVGSHIAKTLAADTTFCVVCVSRTGSKPTHLRDQAWAETVRWCQGDATVPDEQLLKSAYAIVCAVGSPPLPTFNKKAYEQQVFNNGTTSQTAINAAAAAGVKRLVLVSAQIPKLINREGFGYARGKAMGEAAAEQFVNQSEQSSALVMRPGAVYGTRYTASGKAIPLKAVMGPLAKIVPSQFTDVERMAQSAYDYLTTADPAHELEIVTAAELARK